MPIYLIKMETGRLFAWDISCNIGELVTALLLQQGHFCQYRPDVYPQGLSKHGLHCVVLIALTLSPSRVPPLCFHLSVYALCYIHTALSSSVHLSCFNNFGRINLASFPCMRDKNLKKKDQEAHRRMRMNRSRPNIFVSGTLSSSR